MSKYYVDLVDESGNIVDTEDEVFDNREDAEDYALECGSNFAEGADVLDMCGRSDLDPDEYSYEVREED